MDALASRYGAQAPTQPVIWLSGEITTLLNKIGPVIWIAAIGWTFSGVFVKTGHIFIAPPFRLLAGFVVLATVFMIWLSAHLQRVGYSGRDLVISNYLREERIPFNQVEAVEPVWWYRRRMVRVRLRPDTSFGQVVYYIPKWAAIKCLWVAPEKELQKILAASADQPYF